MLFLFLFLLLPAFTAGGKISWELGVPGTPLKFSGCSASLPVSLFYDKSPNTLSVFVRKFLRNDHGVARIVHLVVGGPGQSSDIWLSHLDEYSEIFGKDALFVITDHRGMGRSSPLCNPQDESWKTNWAVFEKKLKYPIQAITVSNAGRDLARVAELLAVEYPNVNQIAVGSSYGSRVVTAAINTCPEIFKVAIMDGLDVDNSVTRLSAVTINNLLENCQKNKYCNRVVGDPARLEQLIPKLKTNRNGCTRLFFDDMKAYLDIEEECDILEVVFYKLLTASERSFASRRQLPSMYIIALLKQFEKCTDESIVMQITEKIHKILKNFAITGTHDGRSSLEMLGHVYIASSEKWRGSLPAYCQICDPRAYKICITAAMYQNYLDYFGPSSYYPTGPSQQPITGKTRILVLAGALDYSTPLDLAQSMFENTKVPSKKILVFQNGGHGLLRNSKCVRQAILAAITDGNYREADACVQRVNSVTLNWEGQDSTNSMKLFDSPPTKDEIKANRPVAR